MNMKVSLAVRNARSHISKAGPFALVMSSLLLMVMGVACSGGSSQSSALGLVPDNVSTVQVWDVDNVLLGDAPDELADNFEDTWEDRLEDIEILIDDLDTLVQAWGEDGWLVVLEGEFDFEQIRDALYDADYDDDEYQGYELWEDGGGFVDAAAPIEDQGRVVMGDIEAVKSVLKSLNRRSGFLLDDANSDIREVLEKAGQGWIVSAFDQCLVSDIRGCEAMGMAESRGDEAFAVEVKLTFMFRNERTAESEMDNLEDYLEDDLPRAVDIEDVASDGVFVVVTVSVDEDDYDPEQLP